MKAVEGYSELKVIKKTTEGIFEDKNKYKDELVNHLKKKKIGTIIIAGVNGAACVWESISGALQNNCSVVAFSKGIADFNSKEFSYPYAGYFKRIKFQCADCSFKELSEVDNVASRMVNSSVKSLNSTKTKKSGIH